MTDTGFLSRWARRKATAGRVAASGDVPQVPAQDAMQPVADAAPRPAEAGGITPPAAAAAARPTPTVPEPDASAGVAAPPPTLADVARLDRDADFSRFVARDVAPDVRNAALRKLFSDPRFNAMDGLDTYIDDYGAPAALPGRLLRRMAQAAALGLASGDPQHDGPPRGDPPHDDPPRPPEGIRDEDADLRLQPDDDAGRARAARSPGEDPGRER